MIFTFLITIVFIAELIITTAIITNLLKLDRTLNRANAYIEKINPEIRTILSLIEKISAQILELTPDWVEKFRQIRNKIILNQIKSLIAGFLFWSINIKVIKKLRKSKFIKAAWQGLSLIQNVI